MKELDLVRLLDELELEMDWRGESLLTWIGFYSLERFSSAIKDAIEDSNEFDCKLQDHGVICIDLVPICDHYGIDPERILKREV